MGESSNPMATSSSSSSSSIPPSSPTPSPTSTTTPPRQHPLLQPPSSLVVELAMQTTTLQKELSTGMVRIALETEKQPRADNNNSKTEKKTDILEEPLWTMYCKGEKTGYGVKREATEEDLNVMELLRPVSMGAGVLPGNSESEGPDGEMAYMRAYFERVIGSKDSETFYMLSPEGNNGPELSFFFVRV